MKPIISLTFDDGIPCQHSVALPILNHRGIKATFFLPVESKDSPLDVEAWKEVTAQGHEIGSHSMTHRKARELNPADRVFETAESSKKLRAIFGCDVPSYCYPYTDAPMELQQAVRASYKQARGGRVAREDKYLVRGDGTNLMNVPAFHVGPYTFCDAKLWGKVAVERSAWLTLMIHGVGEPQAWDNISGMDFNRMLDDLEDAGVTFATFAEGANAYRG